MEQLGKYQLIRKLATGGMAEVFLARADGPKGFQKTLVVKRILPHFAEDPIFTEMFLAEARLAARLDHPNIVQIFDFGELAGTYYLAMEFVDGSNLRALNQNAWERGTPTPFPLCAQLMALACEGLAHAHSFRDPESGEALGLIHRDISPDNILVGRSGALKVADFGLAKETTRGNGTRSGLLKGKIAYMPPEQLAQKPLDHRVDVFALGIVFYELLCGALPFDTTSEALMIQAMLRPDPIPSIGKKRPDVPTALQRIVERAVSKPPQGRYPDCRALQQDLEAYLASAHQTVPGHLIADWVRELEPPQEELGKELADTHVRLPATSRRSPLQSLRDAAPRGQTARWEAQASEEVAAMTRAARPPSRNLPPRRMGPVPPDRKGSRGIAVGATLVLLVAATVGGLWRLRRPEPEAFLQRTPSNATVPAAPTTPATPEAVPLAELVEPMPSVETGRPERPVRARAIRRARGKSPAAAPANPEVTLDAVSGAEAPAATQPSTGQPAMPIAESPASREAADAPEAAPEPAASGTEDAEPSES